MDTLRVRVYNVRFGDAILVSVPDRSPSGETRMRHILIDVGNAARGEGGANSLFAPVIENILEVLDGQPLDLYIMTHEHMDHVQGLLYASEKLGKQLEVDYSWMTASSDPHYYDAHASAREQKRLALEAYRQIETFLAASPQDGEAFQAMMFNNNPGRTRDCVKYLCGLARNTTFVHRERSLEGTHPFQEVNFQIWGPEEDTSVYYRSLKPMALAVSPGSGNGINPELARLVPPPGVDASAFYNLVARRRQGFAENLLAIDQAANNTSLVFSLEWRGWRLLFPGDAELRSWKLMDARGKVQPVHFLKVSHHGSANGTPIDLLDKLMPLPAPDERPRFSVVSSYPGVYSGIPDPGSRNALSARSAWYSVEGLEDGGYLDFEFDEDCQARVKESPVREEPGAQSFSRAVEAEMEARDIPREPQAGLGELNERLHIINLSKDGTFKPSGEFSTRPEDIDAIFEHLAQQEIPQLTLYFHGGMVPEKSGLATARQLLPRYKGEGRNHPVFFVWESGWSEIVRHNLGQIANEPIFERLVAVVVDFVVSRMEQRALPEGLALDEPGAEISPVTEFEENLLAARLAQDEAFQDAVSELISSVRFDQEGGSRALEEGPKLEEELEIPPRSMLSESVVSEMVAEDERGGARMLGFSPGSVVLIRAAVRVFRRVVGRFKARTAHGVYCTVVEEILRELFIDKVAGWLWQQMKEEIRQSFESNAGRAGTGLRGGTYFLERLNKYLASHAELKVSLVGHSAGSIYICRLLEMADKILPASFQFNQVAFLAPGVDFELFKRTLVDHPNRFRSFRMFTMSDEFEVKDIMVPVIYPQSLLYLVSGLLEGDEEKPIVGLQRFYIPESPYQDEAAQAVRAFMLAQEHKRVVWSVAEQGEAGFISGARAHGAFDEDPTTLESVLHLLAG